MERSCIKSINASYEEKVASNKRSRGLDEYRAAQREARGETQGKPRAATPREQSARRHRQAVHKRPHGVTLQAEPAPKKARKDLAAEETVPSGVEEQREEAEEEDDAPLVRSRGLRSRGPVILEEGELADEPIATDEAEQLEVALMGMDDVEISGSQLNQGLLRLMKGEMGHNSLGLLVY